MKKLILCFIAMVALSTVTFADKYQVNDKDVDALFASATEVSSQEINAFGTGALMMVNSSSSSTATLSKPDPWVAFAICTVVGEFGIHRHYLGTSDYMWALYTCTCGGIFGIVPFVDWVVLLVGAAKDDIHGYINNNKFIMW